MKRGDQLKRIRKLGALIEFRRERKRSELIKRRNGIMFFSSLRASGALEPRKISQAVAEDCAKACVRSSAQCRRDRS